MEDWGLLRIQENNSFVPSLVFSECSGKKIRLPLPPGGSFQYYRPRLPFAPQPLIFHMSYLRAHRPGLFLRALFHFRDRSYLHNVLHVAGCSSPPPLLGALGAWPKMTTSPMKKRARY